MIGLPTFEISPQPDEESCGATCLHSVYKSLGLKVSLDDVISQVQTNPDGGTLAVYLGLHALSQKLRVSIHTCNLQVFDPSWFEPNGRDLKEGLKLQAKHSKDPKIKAASEAYVSYLDRGGKVAMSDISIELINKILSANKPIIAGLNCTWLYRSKRELPDNSYDDIKGASGGHFVIIYGMDPQTNQILIADPFTQHPYFKGNTRNYQVPVNRLVGAIMLGIITFDAKLLVIEQ